ncbi:MAG: hypothetical protein P8011_16110 [Acidihalobacter sp.]|uniref:LPD7 domain-containing protein n=1 Tax=Acidihalobacter sp. TaxID=1872108 RepID=UPI00307F044B
METNPQQTATPAQEERTSLLESWKALHEEARALIRAELDDLAERHVEERRREAETIETDKDVWLKEQQAPEDAHASLWALEKARRLEPLTHRHDRERDATVDGIGKPPAWDEWLRQQNSETARQLLAEIDAEREAGRGNGIEGEAPERLRPLSLEGIEGRWDTRHEHVEYRRGESPVFTDTGPRIEVAGAEELDIEAALRLAEQKFELGSPLTLTGDDAFKDQTARVAARLGIAIRNPELQAAWEEERNRLGLPLSLDPDIALRNTIRADLDRIAVTLDGELARQAGAGAGENATLEWTLEHADWLSARADLAQADSATRIALMRAGDRGLDALSDSERSTLEAGGYLDDEGRLNKRAIDTLAVKEELLTADVRLVQERGQERAQEQKQNRDKTEAAEREQKGLRTRNVGEEEIEQSAEQHEEHALDAGLPDFGVQR